MADKKSEKTPKEPKKWGRPLKKIDWAQCEILAAIQCTIEEIAFVCRVDRDTLDAACKREHGMTFSSWYEQFRQGGKVSLRRLMFQAANKGNVTMQIFLSKQKAFLGFTDRLAETVNVSGQIALPSSMSEEETKARIEKMLERMKKRISK